MLDHWPYLTSANESNHTGPGCAVKLAAIARHISANRMGAHHCLSISDVLFGERTHYIRAYDATASLKPVIIALNSGQGVFVIQEKVFAHDFTDLHIVAEARCFSGSAFASRGVESRSFAAKKIQTVENDRELCAVDAANLFF